MIDLELKKRIIVSLIILPIVLILIILGKAYFILLLIFSASISTYEWFNLSKKKNYRYPILIFIFLSHYLAYWLRENNNFQLQNNYDLILFVVGVSIFTDLGGFIFGKIFKGPKLNKISPNKTYSGVIGSYFLSLIFSYIFVLNYYPINLLDLILLTLVLSTASQLGDFFFSYFKRLSNVKDSGVLLPGHGGILDRIDGIIFSVPAFFLILILF